MTDPIHTLDEIIGYGASGFSHCEHSRVYFKIKVYGPSGSVQHGPKSPYEIPTVYSFPVSLESLTYLDKYTPTSLLQRSVEAAMIAGELRCVKGGVQASQRGPEITY